MSHEKYVIEVTVVLPFLLRLEGSYDVLYEDVCSEPRLKDLEKRSLEITFSEIVLTVSRLSISYERVLESQDIPR